MGEEGKSKLEFGTSTRTGESGQQEVKPSTLQGQECQECDGDGGKSWARTERERERETELERG